MTNLLKENGLIYLSDYGEIFDNTSFINNEEREKFLRKISLRTNNELTKKAQRLQSKGWNYWIPGVLQKIRN